MMEDIQHVQNKLTGYLERCVELVETTNKKLFDSEKTNELANYKIDLERKINDVNQLQIRMTIVAPMKAGKSTIINAIIGKECLPTRSDAMTMLPTEVVLKQAKEDANDTPHLTLNQTNREAIQALHKEIKVCLNSYADINDDDKEFVRRFDSNVNMIKAAKEICNKDENFIFTWKQERESDIQEILTFLNDLIRIYVMMRPGKVEASVPQKPGQLQSAVNATGKSLPSTFAQKKDDDDILARLSDHISKLEVIYKPLRTTSSSNSTPSSSSLVKSESCTLILVDTPGPNEANLSSVLRHIVRRELEKADIALVTFNYTTLNTDTDNDIAKEIDRIKKIKGNKDAIYALVNKVDQRRGGDMTDVQVKSHIHMRYNIPENRIFELKAIHALRARRFFAEYDESNDRDTICKKESALDVLREAFPSQWKKQKDKILVPELIETAKELYEESGIDQFLQEVIDTLRKQVVPRCFGSAINTYDQVHQFLTGSIEMRQNGLKLDAQKLNQERSSLQKDMKDISTLKQTYDKQKLTILSEFRTKLHKIFETHTLQTKNEIELLFHEKNESWKDPSMWRDMVREQRFVAGTMVGAVTTGVAITAGIMFGEPVGAAAALAGASAIVGIQAAGYFAEDHKKTVTDTNTTSKPSNSNVAELMKSVSSRLAKIYAVVFTEDEARFDTEAKATQFIDDVKQAANNISQVYYDTISIAIDQLCESISNKLFLQLQQDSLHMMERTNERFNKMFQITRIVPAKFSVQLENATSLQVSPIARYRPVFGLWPFEFEAKDVETRKKATKHCVSREELKKNCLNIIQRNMMMIQEKIIERVKTEMQKRFEDHFKKLQDDLQGYLDIVRRSLDDQSKTQESQKELMLILQNQLDLIENAEKDFKLFESAIREKWLKEGQIGVGEVESKRLSS